MVAETVKVCESTELLSSICVVRSKFLVFFVGAKQKGTTNAHCNVWTSLKLQFGKFATVWQSYLKMMRYI